jgi:WD40 repeat protein
MINISCPARIATFVASALMIAHEPSRAATPEPYKTFKTTAGVARALTFAPDGKSLAAVESVQQRALPPAGAAVGGGARIVGGGGAVSPGAVTMSALDRIVIWNLVKSAKPVAFNSSLPDEIAPKAPPIGDPTWRPPMSGPGLVMTHVDDQTLTAPLADGRLRAWDRSKGAVRATLKGFGGGDSVRWTVRGFLVSPNRKFVAACAWHGGDLQIWEISTGRLVAEVEPQQFQFTSLAISPDSKRIVVTGNDYIEVFDTAGKSQKYIDAGGLGIVEATFLSDGNVLRTLSEERTGSLRDWDLTTGRSTRFSNQPRVFQLQNGKKPVVRKTLFSRDGALLLVARENKPFVLYDARDGKQLARFDEIQTGAPDATFSSDGQYIATTTGEDNIVKVWKVSTLRGETESTSESPSKK